MVIAVNKNKNQGYPDLLKSHYIPKTGYLMSNGLQNFAYRLFWILFTSNIGLFYKNHHPNSFVNDKFKLKFC